VYTANMILLPIYDSITETERVALVSPSFSTQLTKLRWYQEPKGRVFTVYAKAGKVEIRYLALLVLATERGTPVHLNHDPLDCRVENLHLHPPGVTKVSGSDKWKAQVRHKGKVVFLGHHESEELAGLAAKAFLDSLQKP